MYDSRFVLARVEIEVYGMNEGRRQRPLMPSHPKASVLTCRFVIGPSKNITDKKNSFTLLEQMSSLQLD